MPITGIELSDKVSIEYLLGVTHSKSGAKVNINEIQAVQVDTIITGETIVIFKMKYGHADRTVTLSQQDLQMMDRLRSGTERIIPERLELVTRYLGSLVDKVSAIYGQGSITGISYETFSDTKTGPPMYRVTVEHTSIVDPTTSKTTVYLDDETYGKMVRMNGKKTFPGKVQPIHKVKCSVTGVKIPRLTATKYFDSATLKKLSESTFAMKCQCEKGYFCPSIMLSVDAGIDFRSWLSQVDRPNKSGASHFWLGVPVYNSILYSFRVKYSFMEDWSGDKQGKLMAWGISEDETFFYDVPLDNTEKQSLTIMRDMIAYAEQVYQSVEQNEWALQISQIMRNSAAIPCRAKSHNYGTNRKVLEMMQQSGRYDDFMKAFVLSMELYNLCNFCYKDANPAFSLLPEL